MGFEHEIVFLSIWESIRSLDFLRGWSAGPLWLRHQLELLRAVLLLVLHKLTEIGGVAILQNFELGGDRCADA